MSRFFLSCSGIKHRERATVYLCYRLGTGPLPVRLCAAIDLVEYKSPSQGSTYVLSVVDCITQFFIPINDEKQPTVASALVERVSPYYSLLKHCNRAAQSVRVN